MGAAGRTHGIQNLFLSDLGKMSGPILPILLGTESSNVGFVFGFVSMSRLTLISESISGHLDFLKRIYQVFVWSALSKPKLPRSRICLGSSFSMCFVLLGANGWLLGPLASQTALQQTAGGDSFAEDSMQNTWMQECFICLAAWRPSKEGGRRIEPATPEGSYM